MSGEGMFIAKSTYVYLKKGRVVYESDLCEVPCIASISGPRHFYPRPRSGGWLVAVVADLPQGVGLRRTGTSVVSEKEPRTGLPRPVPVRLDLHRGGAVLDGGSGTVAIPLLRTVSAPLLPSPSVPARGFRVPGPGHGTCGDLPGRGACAVVSRGPGGPPGGRR